MLRHIALIKPESEFVNVPGCCWSWHRRGRIRRLLIDGFVRVAEMPQTVIAAPLYGWPCQSRLAVRTLQAPPSASLH